MSSQFNSTLLSALMMKKMERIDKLRQTLYVLVFYYKNTTIDWCFYMFDFFSFYTLKYLLNFDFTRILKNLKLLKIQTF